MTSGRPAASLLAAEDIDSLDLLLAGGPSPAPARAHSAPIQLFTDDDVLELPGQGSPAPTVRSVNQAAPAAQPLQPPPPAAPQELAPAQGSSITGVQPSVAAEAAAISVPPTSPTSLQPRTSTAPDTTDARLAQALERCAELERCEEALRAQVTTTTTQCRRLEQQLREASDQAVVNQMLSEIDRLAAAKQEAERQAAATAEALQEACEEEVRAKSATAEAAELRMAAAARATEWQECLRHLAASQRTIREFEAQLQVVAAERDAALEQVACIDERLEEADSRLRAAQRAEAAGAERQAQLDELQADADGVVQKLREQQRELAAAKKALAAREKAVRLAEQEAEAQAAAAAERAADAEQAEADALALKRQLLHQQAELERGQAALAQRSAAMEAQAAQLEREAAVVAQEHAVVGELRAQRMAEQQVLLGRLAEERGAAARQQSEAERAVDAAKAAELAAASTLAELEKQADAAKRQADAHARRLEQLQERCRGEEERLEELDAAAAEQRQGMEEQVKALLDLGRQIETQSEEVAAAYRGLDQARTLLAEEQARMEAASKAAAAQAKAAAAQREEAEEATRELAQKQAALAAERRRLADERLASLQAGEHLRQLHAQLTASRQQQQQQQCQALEQRGGTESQQPAAKPCPQAVAEPAVPGALPPSHTSSPARSFLASHADTSPRLPVAQADDDSRYRALLADLQSSIMRWQGQLQAGQPLTVSSPGSFFDRTVGVDAEEVHPWAEPPPSPPPRPSSSPSMAAAGTAAVQTVKSSARAAPAPGAGSKKTKKKQAGKAEQGSSAGAPAASQPAVAVAMSHSSKSETVLLDAAYTIPAAASPGAVRKWLRKADAVAEVEVEAEGGVAQATGRGGGVRPGSAGSSKPKTSWHAGIFSFRRSLDGRRGGSRRASEEEACEVADFRIPAG